MPRRGQPPSAIEFAVYDLTGRWLGIPAHVLLGGRAKVAIPVTHSIGLLSLEDAAKEAAQVVSTEELMNGFSFTGSAGVGLF